MNLRMELNIRDNGLKDKDKEEEVKLGRMALIMKVIGKITKLMEKVV